MPSSGKANLPSPWNEFLDELDAGLHQQVKVYCIGGFVLSLYYGLPRTTGDIDYFSAVPNHCINDLQALAGPDSILAKKHKVYLQCFSSHSMPEDFEARTVEMFLGRFQNLRLYAPDPYDLILSKVERHSPKDRDDVAYLAETLHLNPELLQDRYRKELRPYLSNESRHDLTIDLWASFCPQKSR